MAITKKFKVSFDVTVKIDSKTEAEIAETVKYLAKRAGAGEKLDPSEQEMLIQALTHGPDGVVTFGVRQGIRDGVKEMFEEIGDADLFKASPATVKEVF